MYVADAKRLGSARNPKALLSGASHEATKTSGEHLHAGCAMVVTRNGLYIGTVGTALG